MKINMNSAAKEKPDYPKASDATHYGGILTFVGGIFLVMAFAGPYWIQSHHENLSPFNNMGLWEYCFKEYRLPHYQFPRDFYGCHYVYSSTFDGIRAYILPMWLQIVQLTVSAALFVSFSAQILVAMVLMRWPLKFVLGFEWSLGNLLLGLTFSSTFSLFVSLLIFGTQCWQREWLTYPNYNFLSWSYGLAVVSFFFHGYAAYVFFYGLLKQRDHLLYERPRLMEQWFPSPLPVQNGFV